MSTTLRFFIVVLALFGGFAVYMHSTRPPQTTVPAAHPYVLRTVYTSDNVKTGNVVRVLLKEGYVEAIDVKTSGPRTKGIRRIPRNQFTDRLDRRWFPGIYLQITKKEFERLPNVQ